MAKGDQTRSQNKGDEQQRLGQTYLTGVQQQLGNQYGNLYNSYAGQFMPNAQYGTTYGLGTTVPQYSWFNQPSFSGNGTGTPFTGSTGGQTTTVGDQRTGQYNPYMNWGQINVPYSGSNPYAMGGQGGQLNQQTFMKMVEGLPPSPSTLEALAPLIESMGGEVMHNAAGIAGKIKLPNGTIVDVIQGAGIGGTGWQFDAGMGGGGMGGGFSAGGQVIPGGMMSLPGYGNLLNMGIGDYRNIMGRYQDFADTGGYSEADKANIRSRAISPIRSVYDRARQELDRSRALQGGYSPGYATALDRFARNQGQQTSDATTNAEAAIAQMVQSGKLAGLGGMSGLYGTAPGIANMYGNQAINFQNVLGGQGLQGQGLGLQQQGLSQQYQNMLGNQMLTAAGQNLQAAGLQNQFSGLMMGNQNAVAGIPSNFGTMLNYAGGMFGGGQNSTASGVGQTAGSILFPWMSA